MKDRTGFDEIENRRREGDPVEELGAGIKAHEGEHECEGIEKDEAEIDDFVEAVVGGILRGKAGEELAGFEAGIVEAFVEGGRAEGGHGGEQKNEADEQRDHFHVEKLFTLHGFMIPNKSTLCRIFWGCPVASILRTRPK